MAVWTNTEVELLRVTSKYDIAMTLLVLSVVGRPSRKLKNSSVLVVSAILVAETNITPKRWSPTKRDKPKTLVSCIHANSETEFSESFHPGRSFQKLCF